MARKNDKNQLERNLFYNTVVIFLFLLLVFLLFSNLDIIWERINLQKKETRISAYTTLSDMEKRKHLSPEEPRIYFWGDSGKDVIIKRQMKNMKERYVEANTLADCWEAEVLIVGKKSYSQKEIDYLRRLSRQGVIICMAGLPENDNLKNAYVKNFIGIREYGEEGEKTGYRLGAKLLFGEIYESDEEFSLRDITLMQRTEVYASALEEDKELENHELTPMFWRYKESEKHSSVYVINEQLLEQETGYALVCFLMEDIYGTYMYPVINAYCFAVEGMPYSDEYKSEYLTSEYGKDSMGVQNDIFFPQINRCEERYGLFTTWYSKEAETIKEADNTLLQYYVSDIARSEGHIGLADDNGYSLDLDYVNRLQVWSKDFAWKERGVIQIPYDEMNTEEYRTTILEDMCEVRGSGFHCVSINVDEFLSEESEVDWIDYIDNLETVLGTEKKNLYWLDRMTVADAVYRIKSHELIEPVIMYEDDRILVDILNFYGESYFYLRTDKKIKSATECEFEKIANGFYFIRVKNKNAEIFLYE